MQIKLINEKIDEIKADFEVILVVNKNLDHEFIKDKDKFEFFGYDGSANLLLSESRRLFIYIKI